MQEGELTPENPVLDRKIEHDELPACIECGECFTNWNRILTELKNATERKVTNCTLENLAQMKWGVFSFHIK